MEYGYEGEYQYEKKFSYLHDDELMYTGKEELEVVFKYEKVESYTVETENYLTPDRLCKDHTSIEEAQTEGCDRCEAGMWETREIEVPYTYDMIVSHEYVIPDGAILVEPEFTPCRWTGVYWDYEMIDLNKDPEEVTPPIPKDPPPPPPVVHVTEETFNLHVYKNELMHDRQEEMIMVLFEEINKMKIRLDFLESRVYNTPSPMEKPKFPDQIEEPKEPLNLLDSYMKGQSAILNPNLKEENSKEEVKEDELERDPE